MPSVIASDHQPVNSSGPYRSATLAPEGTGVVLPNVSHRPTVFLEAAPESGREFSKCLGRQRNPDRVERRGRVHRASNDVITLRTRDTEGAGDDFAEMHL